MNVIGTFLHCSRKIYIYDNIYNNDDVKILRIFRIKL